MKFMELDEGGFIHHILDDPCITMVPVVNRFGHLNPKTNVQGHIFSYHGHRLLGQNPTEHPAHLLPRSISDEHWNLIMSAGGVAGADDSTDSSTAWQFRWDEQKQAPAKTYYNNKNTLPERKFSGDVPVAGKKPCKKCPDKDKATNV
jgi:hypothetical protein